MRSKWSKMMALLLCMMMYCTAAMAQKNDDRDKSYNFKNIKTVALSNIDFSQVNLDDTMLKRELQSVYEENSTGCKLAVLNNEQLLKKISLSTGQNMNVLAKRDEAAYNEMYQKYLPEYADAYIVAKVVEYSPRTVHNSFDSTWSTSGKDASITDWDKYWENFQKKMDATNKEYREHTEYDTTEFDVTVEFHVYDSHTNKEIFSRRDTRSKTVDDGDELYAHICENFFRDFGKLTR